MPVNDRTPINDPVAPFGDRSILASPPPPAPTAHLTRIAAYGNIAPS